MTELIAKPPTPRTAAEYRGAIDLLLAEMRRMEGEMEQDRVEIERFGAESQAIARHTDVVLGRLDKLMGVWRRAA